MLVFLGLGCRLAAQQPGEADTLRERFRWARWETRLAAQQPGEADTLRERFRWARWETLREKVYLHTDRERDTAGEYIWFRAYRTDAASHVPGVYSRFVYVELYNQRGALVERLKVREEDGVFHGSLKLDPYLAAGKYCLRAYTYWMQNFDEDFYFKKEIDIESAALPDLQREVRWEDGEDGERLFCLRLTTGRGETFPKAQLDCRMYKGQEQVREGSGKSVPSSIKQHLKCLWRARRMMWTCNSCQRAVIC